LLGAAASVAARPGLLDRVFPFADPEVGVYEVAFYRGGEWVKVVVDDR
jgi:hypothetical protein